MFGLGLGVCIRCGDTGGPWVMTAKGWVCEDCLEKEANEVKDNGRPESDNKSRDE